MTGTGDRAWDDARRETRSAMRALLRAARENVKAHDSAESLAAVQAAAARAQAAVQREGDEWRRVAGRPRPDARTAYGASDVPPDLPLPDLPRSIVLRRALAGDNDAQGELQRRARLGQP